MGKSYRILNVVGARPNMMKVAPLVAEMSRHPDLEPILVHTGQHYDYSMSEVFLEQLGMPAPHHNLEVGSGSHHAQTGEVMKRFGELVQAERPDLIVVVGDVNSTVACSLVGAKECIPVAHVEAGLRSGDRKMPEEVNRIVTDALSDLLFTTEALANQNLRREGVSEDKIYFTGNVMIDSLVRMIDRARKSELVGKMNPPENGYAVLTLHRPANVDDPIRLQQTMDAMANIASRVPILFPVHPRTQTRLKEAGITDFSVWDGVAQITEPGIWTMPPASYLDFIALVDRCALVITDSGGIQEETTYLGIPCLTFRDNSERMVTITHGSNRLIGTDPQVLWREATAVLNDVLGRPRAAATRRPEFWDGKASERIVAVMRQFLAGRLARSADA